MTSVLAWSAVMVAGVGVVGFITYDMVTDYQCMERGYRNSRINWDLSQSCGKRIDGKYVVVPLSEVAK